MGNVVDSPIENYIRNFPERTQAKLKEMLAIVRSAAPGATEKIAYRMPTFYLNGNLVHFAGYAKHIGFYPTPSAISAFQSEIAQYKYSKGSVQFPIDKPLPADLIQRMVGYRAAEKAGKS